MKFKKTLLAVGTIATVATPVAAVVACGSASTGITEALGVKLNVSANAESWMVSDGGSVQDKTFNEGALSGVAKYGNEATTHKTYNFAEVQAGKITDGYTKAVAGGAKIVVGAGFNHTDPSKTFFGKAENKDKFFLGIDVDHNADATNVNQGSITYATQLAGYEAAAYSIKYIQTHKNDFEAKTKNGVSTYQLGTFGGGTFPGVTNWMFGWTQAVTDFNDHLAANATFKVEEVYVGDKASASDFTTDNFASPSTDAKKIVTTLMGKGVDVLFPVAGPQIKDAMTATRNSKVKIIGVDGDQYSVYKNPQIIGSALKNLQSETVDALNMFYANPANFKAEYIVKSHDGKVGFTTTDKSQFAFAEAKGVTGASYNDEAALIAAAPKTWNE